eukprot:TRINITY_DN41_c2_g5_i1.p1 TRINITY_DN41_c2_g5~~TRINITY_DN41_c2_g5_i1.p1  ORF type:complete len:807 (-),score=275.47 TRINITY_DN41_c2_g5_i1:126-2546(-)
MHQPRVKGTASSSSFTTNTELNRPQPTPSLTSAALNTSGVIEDASFIDDFRLSSNTNDDLSAPSLRRPNRPTPLPSARFHQSLNRSTIVSKPMLRSTDHNDTNSSRIGKQEEFEHHHQHHQNNGHQQPHDEEERTGVKGTGVVSKMTVNSDGQLIASSSSSSSPGDNRGKNLNILVNVPSPSHMVSSPSAAAANSTRTISPTNRSKSPNHLRQSRSKASNFPPSTSPMASPRSRSRSASPRKIVTVIDNGKPVQFIAVDDNNNDNNDIENGADNTFTRTMLDSSNPPFFKDHNPPMRSPVKGNLKQKLQQEPEHHEQSPIHVSFADIPPSSPVASKTIGRKLPTPLPNSRRMGNRDESPGKSNKTRLRSRRSLGPNASARRLTTPKLLHDGRRVRCEACSPSKERPSSPSTRKARLNKSVSSHNRGLFASLNKPSNSSFATTTAATNRSRLSSSKLNPSTTSIVTNSRKSALLKKSKGTKANKKNSNAGLNDISFMLPTKDWLADALSRPNEKPNISQLPLKSQSGCEGCRLAHGFIESLVVEAAKERTRTEQRFRAEFEAQKKEQSGMEALLLREREMAMETVRHQQKAVDEENARHLESLHESHAQQVNELQKLLTEEHKKLASTREEILSLQQEKSGVDSGSLALLQRKLGEAERQLAEARSKSVTQEDQERIFNARLNEVTDKLKTIEKEKIELEKNIGSKNVSLQEILKKLKHAEDRIKVQDYDLETTHKREDRLLKEIERLTRLVYGNTGGGRKKVKGRHNKAISLDKSASFKDSKRITRSAVSSSSALFVPTTSMMNFR